MSSWITFLSSSIEKKLIMSLTGLSLAVFLLAHMAGNILVVISPQSFNDYAFALNKNLVVILLAEAGLLAVFVVHIAVAIKLTRENRAARPIPYKMRASTGRSRRWWGSSSMIWTGLFIVIFLIIHLKDFKFGPTVMTVQNGQEMRNLAQTVIHEFRQPFEMIFYVLAMIIIGAHLLHGFRSAFETLGVVNTKYDRWMLWISRLFVFIVMGGFILIPLMIYFCGSIQA